MIVEGKVAETSIALGVPAVLGSLPIDLTWALFIFFGLTIGWMARIGRMVEQKKSWVEIRQDLLVSLLIGGGNGLLATIIIFMLGLTYLQGVGVAFLCAFAGLKTIDAGVKWLFRKFLEEHNNERIH